MIRRPCSGPWKTPTIDVNANLTVCCHDKALNYKLGNLKTSNFDELWYGGKAEKLREAHILGKFPGNPNAKEINCANCQGHDSPKITDEEVISYLKQIGNLNLIPRYLDRVCVGSEKIESLLIELTDRCNLNCRMCKQSKYGSGGFMKFELWKSIIKDLARLKIKAITPFWYGEPLIHPEFLNFIKYAFNLNYNKEYDNRLTHIKTLKDEALLKDFVDTYPFNNKLFDYMELHTNGVLLTKEIMDYLFSPEGARSLGYLVFSIDASKKDTYNKIRIGGDFDKVIKNLKYCISLKSKLLKSTPSKSIRPVIVVQFIVMQENANEAEEFVDFWKSEFDKHGIPCQINGGYSPPFLKDTIFLRPLGDLEPENQPAAWKLHDSVLKKSKHFKQSEVQSPKSKVSPDSRLQTPDYIRPPCAGPWKTPVIRWDGELGVCCYDDKMELSLGNVNEYKLSWLWNMDKALNLRLGHIRGEFPERCLNCPNLDSPTINDYEIAEYLEGNNEELLEFLRRMKNYKLLRKFI